MKEAPEAVARMVNTNMEYLEAALPLLEELVEREQAMVMQKVWQASREGTLTGDKAVAFWLQFLTPEAFLARARGKLKEKSVILTQATQAATTE